MKLNVYYYDFSNHYCIKVIDYNHFREIDKQYQIWGITGRFKMKRMVISKKELPLVKGK